MEKNINVIHPTPAGPQAPDPSFARAAATYGLHPFVAFGMVAIDHMLFVGLELPSFGLLAVISFFVGWALTVPCALIQYYVYRDSAGAAIGKALLVGLLTAVPSSLPSVVTTGWGVVGLIGAKYRKEHSNAIDTKE